MATESFIGQQGNAGSAEFARRKEAEIVRDSALANIVKKSLALTSAGDAEGDVRVSIPLNDHTGVNLQLHRRVMFNEAGKEPGHTINFVFAHEYEGDRPVTQPLLAISSEVDMNGAIKREQVTYPLVQTGSQMDDLIAEADSHMKTLTEGLDPEQMSAYERTRERQELEEKREFFYQALDPHIHRITSASADEPKDIAFMQWCASQKAEGMLELAQSARNGAVADAELNLLRVQDSHRENLIALGQPGESTLYNYEIDFLSAGKSIDEIFRAERHLVQFDNTPVDNWERWRDTGKVSDPKNLSYPDALTPFEIDAMTKIQIANSLENRRKAILEGAITAPVQR